MEEALRYMLVHSYNSIKNPSLTVNLRIFLASIIDNYWPRLAFKIGSFTSVVRVSELSAGGYSLEGITGGPFSGGSIGSVSGVRSVAAGILPLDSYSFIEVLVHSYRPLNVMAEEYFH